MSDEKESVNGDDQESWLGFESHDPEACNSRLEQEHEPASNHKAESMTTLAPRCNPDKDTIAFDPAYEYGMVRQHTTSTRRDDAPSKKAWREKELLYRIRHARWQLRQSKNQWHLHESRFRQHPDNHCLFDLADARVAYERNTKGLLERLRPLE